MMAAVLEQVGDWETLTGLLDITRSAIDNINKNCASFERAQCQWRELVKTYCDKIQSGNPYDAATGIARILRRMQKTKEAHEMKQLDFCTPTRREFCIICIIDTII